MDSSTNGEDHVLPAFYINSLLKHSVKGMLKVMGFSRNGATDAHELWVIVQLLGSEYEEVELISYIDLLNDCTEVSASENKDYLGTNFIAGLFENISSVFFIQKGTVCKHFKGGEYSVLGFFPRYEASEGLLEDIVFYFDPTSVDPISTRHRTVSDFITPMDRVLKNGTHYVGPRFYPVQKGE